MLPKIIESVVYLFMSFYVPMSYFLVLLVMIFFLICMNDIYKLFKKVSRNSWCVVALLVVLALFLRMSFSRFDQTTPDSSEWEYKIKAACLTPNSDPRFKSMAECQHLGDVHQIGFPIAISFFYTLFGVSSLNLYVLNTIIGALSVAMIFLVVYLIFENEGIALLSSFIFAIDESNIFFSGTGEVETFFVFALVFSVICFLVATKTHKLRCYALFVLSVALAGNIRKEGGAFLVVIGFFGVLLLVSARRWKSSFVRLLCLSPILIFFTVPTFFLVSGILSHAEGQGNLAPFLAVSNLHNNLPGLWIDGAQLFHKFSFFSYFMVIGLLSSIKRIRQKFFLAVWFFIPNLLYYSYRACPGCYFINTKPPLIILAGLGLVEFFEFVNKFFEKCKLRLQTRRVGLTAALSVLIIISILLMNVNAAAPWKGEYLGEAANIKRLAQELGNNSCILVPHDTFELVKFETNNPIMNQDGGSLYDLSGNSVAKNTVQKIINDNNLYFFETWTYVDKPCDEHNLWRCKEYQEIKDNFNLTFVKRSRNTFVYKVDGVRE